MKYFIPLALPLLILGCGSEDTTVNPAGPSNGWTHMIINEAFQEFTYNVWSYQDEDRSGMLDHYTKINLDNSNFIFYSIKTESPSEFEYTISLDDTLNYDTWTLDTNKLSENDNVYWQSRFWSSHNNQNLYAFYIEAIDRNNFSIIAEHQLDVGDITSFLALGSCSIIDGNRSGTCSYTYDGTEITAGFDANIYQSWFDLAEADKKVSDLALPLSLAIDLDYYSTNQLTTITPSQGQWIDYSCYNGTCQKWHGVKRKLLATNEPISISNINFFTKYNITYTNIDGITYDTTQVTLSESNLDIENSGWWLETNILENGDTLPYDNIQSRRYYQRNEVTGEFVDYQFNIKSFTNTEIKGSASINIVDNDAYSSWSCNITDDWEIASCRISSLDQNSDLTRIVNLKDVGNWINLVPPEQSEIDISVAISVALNLTFDDLVKKL